METILKKVPGAVDVVADRIVGKSRIPHRSREDRPLRSRHPRRSGGDRGGHRRREPTMSVEGASGIRSASAIRANSVTTSEELQRILVPCAGAPRCRSARLPRSPHARPPGDQERELLLVGYVTLNTRDRDEVSVVEGGRRPDPGEDRGRRTDSSTGILLPVGRAV